jgi:7,8-dihydroneopterin aldolase/epimerase/oxygenase
MFTIHLHKLHFFAYHGLYEEEKQTGNNFELDVDITANVRHQVTVLDHTVDYVKIYDIIEERMKEATPLLETLAQDLVERIRAADNRISSVSITVKKMNAPIKDFKGIVGVSFKKDFN